MFIKVIYEETNQPCILNTDYIIDIFYDKCRWKAYTFDNERRGYIIDSQVVDKLLEDEKEAEININDFV